MPRDKLIELPSGKPAEIPPAPLPTIPTYSHIPASRLQPHEFGAWVQSIIAYPTSAYGSSIRRDAERFRDALVDAHLGLMGSLDRLGWDDENTVFKRGWKKLEQRYLSGTVVTRCIQSDIGPNAAWKEIAAQRGNTKATIEERKHIDSMGERELVEFVRDQDLDVNLDQYASLAAKRHVVASRCKGPGSGNKHSLMTNYWKPSKPVLHLCAALATLIDEACRHRDVFVPDQELWHILAGEDVGLLLEHAQRYRPMIPKYFDVAESQLIDIHLT